MTDMQPLSDRITAHGFYIPPTLENPKRYERQEWMTVKTKDGREFGGNTFQYTILTDEKKLAHGVMGEGLYIHIYQLDYFGGRYATIPVDEIWGIKQY